MKKLSLLLLSLLALQGFSQTACVDDGFENLTAGSFSSSVWTGGAYSLSGVISCNNPASTYNALSGNQISIISTPTGTLDNSPFPGNKVAYLNSGYSSKLYMSKTINVTPSNFVYRFAYNALLGGNSCSAGMLLFRFYDCSNNLISNLTKTIQPTNSVSGSGTDLQYWKPATGFYNTQLTSGWVIHSENLSAYVGSCVSVRVDVMPCVCGGYMSYCYFDDMCADRFITANSSNTTNNPDQHFISSSSYLSCVSTATLAGLPGFSSYSWQGPAGSGVSGSTLSAISTTASGVYTLTASSGTFTATQQVSVTVTPAVNITGSALICQGFSGSLLGTIDPGILTYSWSTGAATPSITVNPTTTSSYTLTTTNTLSCTINSYFTVNVIPPPSISITTPSTTICAGEPFNLYANALMQNGLVWNTGNITSQITVTAPAGNHTYSVLVTDPNGCHNSAAASVTVDALPQLQISGASGICAGQSNSIQAQGNDIVSYLWSNGSSSASPGDSPAQTALYSVTVTGSNGCKNTASQLVTVNTLPQIQLSASQTQVCKGESVQLDVSGANGINYTWNTGATGASLMDSPQHTYTYVVTATDANGCSSLADVVIQVSVCTGIEKLLTNADGFAVFPNPAKDILMIRGSQACQLSLVNSAGQLIHTFELSSENNYTLTVSGLAKGLYFIRAGASTTKLVIE